MSRIVADSFSGRAFWSSKAFSVSFFIRRLRGLSQILFREGFLVVQGFFCFFFYPQITRIITDYFFQGGFWVVQGPCYFPITLWVA
jgi:hypothetical protein